MNIIIFIRIRRGSSGFFYVLNPVGLYIFLTLHKKSQLEFEFELQIELKENTKNVKYEEEAPSSDTFFYVFLFFSVIISG